jgi:hypothetical protein
VGVLGETEPTEASHLGRYFDSTRLKEEGSNRKNAGRVGGRQTRDH